MKYAKQLVILIALTLSSSAIAQDGEGLFKSKCNTCHALGKNSTGPNLKGVKAKWEEAGEGDLIYDWVKNPQTLISSGNSTMAMKAKDFSPTDMTPQPVSNEEIDAILDFVDNWVEPEMTGDPPAPGEKAVMIVPNYDRNLTMFYFLAALLIVQVGGILVLGNSLTSIVKIELMKQKKGNGSAKIILALAGMFGLMAAGNSSYALTFIDAGTTTEATPWLLVEDSDIYFMVALNALTTGILLYMRRSFMEMMRAIRPEAVKARSLRRKKTVNKILTDVVPIEEEHTILMHHEYDGIKELDNNLPPWWVWGFYFTIGFALIYLVNYHVLGTGDLQYAEYDKEMAQAKKEVSAYLDKMAMNVDENTATLMTESKDLSAGKTLYDVNCVTCHNPDGEGNVGPNLTDKNWIYGYDIKEVFKTVKNGTPKGMPDHKSKMNPVQIQQVSSYVLSLPEKKGKTAEGDIVEK
jgi:cytochrome c oxidase cbb3-type subunit 3